MSVMEENETPEKQLLNRIQQLVINGLNECNTNLDFEQISIYLEVIPYVFGTLKNPKKWMLLWIGGKLSLNNNLTAQALELRLEENKIDKSDNESNNENDNNCEFIVEEDNNDLPELVDSIKNVSDDLSTLKLD